MKNILKIFFSRTTGTEKLKIYMKALLLSTKTSLLKSWPPWV
jgi:hypothetical protein